MNSESSASKKVEFTIPAGFKAPENVEPGKDWDMVCSFRMEGDKICMTKLGDVDMPGYGTNEGEDKHETETKPDYSQYSQGIMQAGNNQGMGAGAGGSGAAY